MAAIIVTLNGSKFKMDDTNVIPSNTKKFLK